MLEGINIWAFKVVDSIASTQLNYAMSIIGKSFLVVLPLILLYMLFRKDKNLFSFAFAVVALYIVGDLIKFIVKEPRPCSVADLAWINHIGCEASYSFPSDHATVLTGLLAFMNKYKYIRVLYFVWLVLVLFGRVYLGLHYFTDVIAGVVLSIVLIAVIYKYRRSINDILEKIFRFVTRTKIKWQEA